MEPDMSDFKIGHGDLGRKPNRARKIVRAEGKYLKGPIPWGWLTRAANLPGATALVALAIWFEVGCRSKFTFPLGNQRLGELGVNRWGKSRAIHNLEESGLIRVERPPGRNPIVTVLFGGDT
jgi:hypothetical protein